MLSTLLLTVAAAIPGTLFDSGHCSRITQATETNVTVFGCLFQNMDVRNNVGNDANGGSILLGQVNTSNAELPGDNVNLRVDQCHFANCSAKFGGGIASRGQTYTIEFSTAAGCFAIQQGSLAWVLGASKRIANITYVGAWFGSADEGTVYCHVGLNVPNVIIRGLNASSNTARLAAGYYIGRHATLSILGCTMDSNSNATVLRLSFGSEGNNVGQVECVSLINNTCSAVSAEDTWGLVWFRTAFLFTSCAFLGNRLSGGCTMFHACTGRLIWGNCPYNTVIPGTFIQCIFDTDRPSTTGPITLSFANTMVVSSGTVLVPCATATPTQSATPAPARTATRSDTLNPSAALPATCPLGRSAGLAISGAAGQTEIGSRSELGAGFAHSETITASMDLHESGRLSDSRYGLSVMLASGSFSDSARHRPSLTSDGTAGFDLSAARSASSGLNQTRHPPPSPTFTPSSPLTSSEAFNATGGCAETYLWSALLFDGTACFDPSAGRSASSGLNQTRNPPPSPTFTPSSPLTRSEAFNATGGCAETYLWPSGDREFRPTAVAPSLAATRTRALEESGSWKDSALCSLSSRFNGSDGFTGSGHFTGSGPFTRSSHFAASVQFTGSGRFNGSDGFTGSGHFTGSGPFTRSSHFAASVHFTGSGRFASSVRFAVSAPFTASNRFATSRGFVATLGFTPSESFAGGPGAAAEAGSNTVLISSLVAGAVLLILVCCFLVFMLLRRRKKSLIPDNEDEMDLTMDGDDPEFRHEYENPMIGNEVPGGSSDMGSMASDLGSSDLQEPGEGSDVVIGDRGEVIGDEVGERDTFIDDAGPGGGHSDLDQCDFLED